jgi:hypothetical protein
LSRSGAPSRLRGVIVDLVRLLLGLLVMLFHRPLANFIMVRERALDRILRARGVRFPAPPSESMAHNIYFSLGAFICVISMARIWFSLQG